MCVCVCVCVCAGGGEGHGKGDGKGGCTTDNSIIVSQCFHHIHRVYTDVVWCGREVYVGIGTFRRRSCCFADNAIKLHWRSPPRVLVLEGSYMYI